jgi:FAD dependent oxidoreductase TIGR03364
MLVVGGWWLVVGGLWLVVCEQTEGVAATHRHETVVYFTSHKPPTTNHQRPTTDVHPCKGAVTTVTTAWRHPASHDKLRCVSTSRRRVQLAVVGGGILGLAHAYLAAKRGRSVVLFERHPQASGASVRNFGTIWPIGQPAGEMHQLALRSRTLWLDMLRDTGLPYFPTGSLHLAYRQDEFEVLEEFADLAPDLGYQCQLESPDQIRARSAAVKSDGLLGGLWSDTELTVDPRRIVGALPDLLREMGVEVHFSCPVIGIDLPRVDTSRGEWQADAAIVCSGDDFETLYPETFATSGLTRCKLQMMRTAPQPEGWRLGPALAAGLTLRFYKAFRACRSLNSLRERIARDRAAYDRWHIHTLVAQTVDGAITLGDSHEYGDAPAVFDRAEIDELILDEVRTYLRLPVWRLAERWHGTYAWHPEQPVVACEPAPGVRIVTGVGGAGMTLSFGLAERTIG